MGYFREFRTGWRNLAATALGLAAGLGMTAYLSSIFAPHLIAEFGWSRAQFALTNVTSMVMFLAVPIAGRLADRFGVRRVAMVGVAAVTLCLVAFSLMRGSFSEYIAIHLVLTGLGAATTSTVYTRIVVDRFEKARGLALAIAIAGPATVGALGGPLLVEFIEAHGWRAGFQATAMFAAVGGIVALALAPMHTAAQASVAKERRALRDYPAILANPVFWQVFLAMFLCNLPQTLGLSQLALVLMDSGISTAQASSMVSLYATGVLIGRFICGVSLDRLPTPPVAAFAMGLPALGLFVLASSVDAPVVLGGAILLLGLSQGAEGDLIAYIVARYFPADVYGSVLGLTNAAIGIGAAAGAGVLSLILKFTGSFALFLGLTGWTVLAGSALLLLLGRGRQLREAV